MESFSQYIEKQRQEGTVESAGSFTLAIEKARDKLGKHTLSLPEEYILKVVQCAACLRAEKMSFYFTRSSVLVYFETTLDDRTLSVENLTQALLTPLEESVRARAHLGLALCSVASLSPSELIWGDWGGDGSSLVLNLGRGRSELFRDVPFPRTEPLIIDRRMHLLYIAKERTSRLPLNQTSVEKKLLRERCCFAPIKIEINGRPLKTRLPIQHIKGDPVNQWASLYIGAIKFECEPPNVLTMHCDREDNLQPLPPRLSHLVEGHPPAFLVQAPPHWSTPFCSDLRFQKLYLIPSHLYGTSLLYFVQDGVLLNPVHFHDAGGGATAVLCGDSLKTDITGLNVVRDEECREQVESCVREWKSLIGDFIESKPPVYNSGLFGGGEEIVYYAFGCCLLSPVGHLVRIVLDYLTQSERRKEVLQKKYQRQLETRKNWLVYFRKSEKSSET